MIKINIVNHFDYILCVSVEKLKEIYLKFLDKLYNIISSLKSQNKSIEVFHSNNLENIYIFIYPSIDITIIQSFINKFIEIFYQEKEIKFLYKIGYTINKVSEDMLHEAEFAIKQIIKNDAIDINQYDNHYKIHLLKQFEYYHKINSAIENNELFIYIQPKYNLLENKIIGGEALIRWKHKGEFIPPNLFIPILEETKSVYLIDQWMLKNIINLQKTHLDKNIFLFLSINLSPEEIENITFYKQILNILEKLNYFDFSLKSLLEIEITERTFFYNFKEINERLKFLRQKHIKISIDDFGVNYSSLSLLPKLPIDIIKIDKIFIDNLEEKNYRVLVKSMIDLCHKLNYDVIAEGVETEKQKEILLELGCDKIQGYYYSPPIPVEKYIELIQ